MITIAIYGRPFNESFNDSIHGLFDKLKESNVNVVIFRPFYEFLEQKLDFIPEVKGFFTNHEDLSKDVDYMISIGGDGTFLDTVGIVRDSGIPVVGINSGRLGFLANIAKEDVDDALDAIVEKKFTVEERTLLQLETSQNMFGDFSYALNEFTIHKMSSSSMIKVHAFIDGELLNSYWGDGLIVSTPTGSTAYSLSVGGPIVVPKAKNFIISPIAPHNLTVRPIVVTNDSEIVLKVEGRGDSYLASLDSRSVVLDPSIEVKLKLADFTIKLLKFSQHSFYSTLRNKLMWGVDKRN